MSSLKSINKVKAVYILAVTVAAVLLSACSKGHNDEQGEPVNLPPEVMAQAFTTQTEMVIHDRLKARDPEYQALSFTLVRAPESGQLALSGNGDFSYIPNEETTGSDSFIFNVSDGVNPAVTARAEITIEVLRVNFSSFSRLAFEQANEVPLSVNGREFTDDINSADFYADLFLF